MTNRSARLLASLATCALLGDAGARYWKFELAR